MYARQFQVVRTRDLFAGCSVSIAPHDDVWLVSLVDNALHTVVMGTYQELPEALETVHDWLLMLADNEEVGAYAARAVYLIREAMARSVLGEAVPPTTVVDEALERDDQREWFEREMGTQ